MREPKAHRRTNRGGFGFGSAPGTRVGSPSPSPGLPAPRSIDFRCSVIFAVPMEDQTNILCRLGSSHGEMHNMSQLPGPRNKSDHQTGAMAKH